MVDCFFFYSFSVAGALGALGSRYGTKAMKTGSMLNFLFNFLHTTLSYITFTSDK